MKPQTLRWWKRGLVAAVLLLALALRGAGTYRGLSQGVSYHPDAAKQVKALGEYLEGRYVWYTGLRFYDSYPYFLNHFDEWIIRTLRAAADPVAAYLGLGADRGEPTNDTLYYWSMTLRWLYGVAVVLLAGVIARRLRFPFPAAFAAMLLVAVSPLNGVVAHFATGDIACDLFFALTVLCAAQHVRSGRLAWLAAAGAMAGWTFAGKYNGGMAAFLIAGYAFMLCLRGRYRLARFAGIGLLSAGGLAAGILIAMPQFTWAWKRTWHDMLRVFEHVQNYRAPEDYLARPFWDRAWIALSRNTGDILWGLGPLLLLAALVGLGLAIREWRRQPAGAEQRRASLLVALFAFPWLVLALSLVSKLSQHEFYFSWIYPALALAAAFALAPLWTTARRRPAFVLLGLALLGEAGHRLPAEIYFWRREDVRTVSRVQEDNPVLPATRNERYRGLGRRDPSPNAIRDLLFEPLNLATFRNRWGRLASPDAAAWRNLAVVPLPVVPFGGPLVDWIAWNGPALPRSDWTFKVDGDKAIDLIVVAFEPLAEARLGFQTGNYPSFVKGAWGGVPVNTALNANDWTVCRLADLRPVRTMNDAGRSDLPIYHYRLRLRAGPGPVWATLLRSPHDEEVFRLFNGDAAADLAGLYSQVDAQALATLVARIRYRAGDANGLRLPAAKTNSANLWSPEEVLPAGPYRLKMNVLAEGSNAVVRVGLRDRADRTTAWNASRRYELVPGNNEIEYPFEKPFAPFQCAATVDVLSGAVRLGAWSLLPDMPALAAAVEAGTKPAWQRRFAEEPVVAIRHPVETVFGDAIVVHDVAWPDPVVPGRAQPFATRVSLRQPIRNFAEYEVFIHLCGQDGKVLESVHVAMDQAACAPEDAFAVMRAIPAAIAPQIGQIRVGVWNRRTLLQLPVTEHPASVKKLNRRTVLAGEYRVDK